MKSFVFMFVLVVVLLGCAKSPTAPVNRDGLRAVVGTSLIGAHGRTANDQDKIDDTVAGLCGGGVWRKSECARHTKEVRQ